MTRLRSRWLGLVLLALTAFLALLFRDSIEDYLLDARRAQG